MVLVRNMPGRGRTQSPLRVGVVTSDPIRQMGACSAKLIYSGSAPDYHKRFKCSRIAPLARSDPLTHTPWHLGLQLPSRLAPSCRRVQSAEIGQLLSVGTTVVAISGAAIEGTRADIKIRDHRA